MNTDRQPIKLAIIIPVFNGLEFTKRCLHTLYDVCRIGTLENEYAVVVVDDNSTDGSADWITKNYKHVKVLNGDGNLWWSGGINLGAKFAIEQLGSDYIIWWNNDITPDKDYFMNLERILTDLGMATIIGSKIYMDSDFKTIWSMGGIFNPSNGNKYMLGSGMQDSSEYMISTEVDWLPGMGTIVHQSIFQHHGFLDNERFPQYHGDSDFTLRAKAAGHKIKVYPELRIFNDTSNSGIRHQDSFKKLMRSLTSLKSNYNIKKDILFYHVHAQSVWAYGILFKKYFRYLGGFLKWKLVGYTGLKREA